MPVVDAGFNVEPGRPEQFCALMKREVERRGEIVRRSSACADRAPTEATTLKAQHYKHAACRSGRETLPCEATILRAAYGSRVVSFLWGRLVQ